MKTLFACVVLALLPSLGVAQQYPTLDRQPSQLLIEEFGKSLGIGAGLSARPLNRASIELIKEFEGWVPSAYNDAVGYCTIGYGHLIDFKRCEQIDLRNLEAGKFNGALTEANGMALLDEDSAKARIVVQRLVRANLNDDQFGALSSFVFNVGRANFEKSTMLRLLNQSLHREAAVEFRRWVLAGDQKLAGLVNRRACEEALFKSQLVLASNGRINRNACGTLGIAPSGVPLVDIRRGE